MKKYVCEPCGYEYDPAVGDPDNGVAPGTPFEDLPDDWVCPICGREKRYLFQKKLNASSGQNDFDLVKKIALFF